MFSLTLLLALHCTPTSTFKDTQAMCLVSNVWTQRGNLTANDNKCNDITPIHYGYTSLITNDSTTELYAVVSKCPNSPEWELLVRKYVKPDWVDMGTFASDTAPNYPYAQFDVSGAFISFLTAPLQIVVNNYHSTTLDILDGATWATNAFMENAPGPVRHPAVYSYPATSRAFVLYGEPKVELWEVFNDDVQPFSAIPSNDIESTLYTDMTMWNGQPVIAYDYYNKGAVSWQETKDKTRIISYDGTTWNTLTDSIQDTYGHDGVKSHVFVTNGKLYCMYFDYSSVGVPSNAAIVRGRFRVKAYDAVNKTWTKVGGESPIFMLSQKFEYFDEGNTVYFDAIVRSLPYYLQQSWKWNGQFVRFGPNVRVMNQGSARPGNVVTYTGP